MRMIGITIATVTVMAILMFSAVSVMTNFAAADNSSVTTGNGTFGKIEDAKSGINTTVCGADEAHACRTSSGGQ